jgi:hypothetical protein
MWEWAKLHPVEFFVLWLITVTVLGVVLEKIVRFHIQMRKIKWYQDHFMDDYQKPSLIKGGKNPPPSGARPDFTPPPTAKREDQ